MFKKKWEQTKFLESSRRLTNPGRGWYHIYSFRIKDEKEEIFLDGEEVLALVRIDISAFREGAISAKGLCQIEQIFSIFQESGKEMILRFVYDTEGKVSEKEPALLKTVLLHMRQTGEVVRRFQGSVLAVQGVFVGNWGEMHGSRFLTDANLALLTDTMLTAIGENCPLAVRTLTQLTMLQKALGAKKGRRLMLFDDGIFGSETDLGTYENREAALSFLEKEMEGKFVGGEALNCLDGGLIGFEQAAADFKRMHLSYLNSSYQPEILEKWKEEKVTEPGPYQGLSGYEYLERHLGYRFVLRNARLDRRGLEIEIENVGFAAPPEKLECRLRILGEDNKEGTRKKEESLAVRILGKKTWKKESLAEDVFLEEKQKKENPSEDESTLEDTAMEGERKPEAGSLGRKGMLLPVDISSERWISGQKSRLFVEKEKLVAGGGGAVYLELIRQKDGKEIRFANEGAAGLGFLGCFHL